MDNLKIGQFITDQQQRDAIHVAVMPVVAAPGERLSPGQDIGLVDGSTEAVCGGSSKPVGIVDPFLKGRVLPGDRFWMFLYPGSITSLRHDWTHPGLPAAVKPADAPPTGRAWLEKYAKEIGMDVDADELIGHATDFLDHDDYWCEGSRFDCQTLPGEFWDHFQEATGRMVPADKRHSFFSCSC